MTFRRTNEVAVVSRYHQPTKIQSTRLFILFLVVTTMGSIAHRAAAGIGGGDIDTYTYHWSLPNQTGQTAYGMQWLLGGYSISNIEEVFELTPGGYPDGKLAYTDPMFDNRVIWSGSSTPQGESAFFGFEGTSELGDFTGNWLNENDQPLAPTFDFSPPSWEYVPGHEEYVVQMQNQMGSRYWIQRRLSYLESSISLDREGAAEKLFDEARLIDTSPHFLQKESAGSLELRMEAEPGVVGFLLAYDVYEDDGANPGRHVGRFLNAVSLDDGTPDPPLVRGDFDGNGKLDGDDFLRWQRGESPNPLSAKDLTDWQTGLGMSAPKAAIAAAVPEPTTGIILLIGTAIIFTRRQMLVPRLKSAWTC